MQVVGLVKWWEAVILQQQLTLFYPEEVGVHGVHGAHTTHLHDATVPVVPAKDEDLGIQHWGFHSAVSDGNVQQEKQEPQRLQ